jgi:glycosyltransferase involved in cell wall biosynthesis
MDRRPNRQKKVLFILKLRHDYSCDYGANHLATGMFNSAKFVTDMLNSKGIESKVVIVVDNNSIDREVTLFRPTHVFIEGLWVVPEKFEVLMPLHRDVTWVIRVHSEIPFLAQEGNAMNWIFEYMKRGVHVSCNSDRVNNTLRSLVGDLLDLNRDRLDRQMPLLPNYYPIDSQSFVQAIAKMLEKMIRRGRGGRPDPSFQPKTHFDIGCFGAIRPLKNQLIQAIAAVEFAKRNRVGLRFHINTGRFEQNGSNQYKNIKALFDQLGPNFELIEHPWMTHDDFKKLLRDEIDIAMQVSLSETFNIVTADAISVGTPTVVSPELSWCSTLTFAEPTNIESIVETLDRVWRNRDRVAAFSHKQLERYSDMAERRWIQYLKSY